MTNGRVVMVLAAAVFTAATASAQVSTETVAGVTNFRQVKSTVACAGATTPEAMRGIKDMGFIAEQLGMFSYSGLTKDQMVALRTQHGIYGTDAGRMCVAALNSSNVDQVAGAIASVR